jgi:hypothetical protein
MYKFVESPYKGRPEYYDDLANIALENNYPITEKDLINLESDPRYRSSLVHNKLYHELVARAHRPNGFYYRPTQWDGPKKDEGTTQEFRDNQETIKVFRKAVHDLARISKADKITVLDIRRDQQEEARPIHYPMSLSVKPTSSDIKQYILFTLKGEGWDGLSIKELAQRTGIHRKYISAWLRGQYAYVPESNRPEIKWEYLDLSCERSNGPLPCLFDWSARRNTISAGINRCAS